MAEEERSGKSERYRILPLLLKNAILITYAHRGSRENERCNMNHLLVVLCTRNAKIDSRFVSRHHCQIITTRDSCVIEDLNSTNGIVIKAKRVRHQNLNDGDVVTIGRHDLLYVDERVRRNTAAHAADQA